MTTDNLAKLEAFIQWLDATIAELGISDLEFERRGGMSVGSLHRLRTRGRLPTDKICSKIGKALNLPPEEIMRRAGILPARYEDIARGNLTLSQIYEIAKDMSLEEQRQLRDYALFLLRDR